MDSLSAEIKHSFRLFTLWRTLAWNDVVNRYRRSVLGPFWITLSMATTLLAMGPLYGSLFQLSLQDFMPHLSVGLIFWSLFTGMIIESSTAFNDAAHFIRQTPLPFPLYILRVTWRQLIILLHNLTVLPFVFLFFPPSWSWNMLLIFPALLLTVLFLSSVGLITAILCTRYRDLAPIVTSVMTLLFFITPIIWQLSLLPSKHQRLAQLNPFTHFIELLRGTILGQCPSMLAWVLTSSLALLTALIACFLITKTRTRIAYWI
ncbi:ABC transporter permease [Rosenbergiella australiborealis]|uniref:Transport permease protein n=1 Tax=Rosenbergiella australiborealis TaxID=1544696 RepID=A0ABS5T3F1_9GAMM|nr:ABC transporter permease [Rosenbergiella australiborealis]MBT0726871.1 ABC transporter permease [Rosenbergiella australiborealis]